MRWTYTNKEIR